MYIASASPGAKKSRSCPRRSRSATASWRAISKGDGASDAYTAPVARPASSAAGHLPRPAERVLFTIILRGFLWRVNANSVTSGCKHTDRGFVPGKAIIGLSALGATSRSGARCTGDIVIAVSRSPIIGATHRSCPLGATAPPASPRRVVLTASRRVASCGSPPARTSHPGLLSSGPVQAVLTMSRLQEQ